MLSNDTEQNAWLFCSQPIKLYYLVLGGYTQPYRHVFPTNMARNCNVRKKLLGQDVSALIPAKRGAKGRE